MVDDIVATATTRAQVYGSNIEIFGAAEGQTVQL
jgi:hypothetical protein